MKNLFLFLLAALIIFSQLVNARGDSGPGGSSQGGAVVLWWATGADPIQKEMVARFRSWLSNQGLPDIDVRIDSANRGKQKFLMQGVTGVANDLTDTYGSELMAYDDVGLLAEIRSPWIFKAPHFTHLDSEYRRGGRYVGYPRAVNFNILWVNREAFRRLGMAEPPERWTLDEFERIGLEFDQKANAGLSRRKFFFIDGLGMRYENLRHSVGVAELNETLSAPTIDSPAMVALLTRIKKWREVDHLVPTAAELSSFNVDQGMGNASFQVFVRGDIALTSPGRWMTQQLRNMKSRLEVKGVEFPHGGFPNTTGAISGVAIYRGTRHRKEAELFLQYLSTPEFSRYLCAQVESLPPDPAYADHPDLIHPVGHANEWAYHEAFARAGKSIVVSREYSPYVPYTAYERKLLGAFDSFHNGLLTASGTAQEMQRAMAVEMTNNLARHPELRPAWELACRKQREIDGLKSSGKKIPVELIDNPYLKAYLKFTGKAE